MHGAYKLLVCAHDIKVMVRDANIAPVSPTHARARAHTHTHTHTHTHETKVLLVPSKDAGLQVNVAENK